MNTLQLSETENYYIENLEFDPSKYNLSFYSESRNLILNIFNENEERYYSCRFIIRRGHGYLSSVLIFITFYKIEKILMPLLVEYELQDKLILKYLNEVRTVSIKNFESFSSNELRSNFPIYQVETEEQKLFVLSQMNNIWKNNANRFFNNFRDIRDLLPYLEVEDEKLIDYINPIFGQQRKLIVWWLCSHPGYENYYDFYLNRLIKLQEKGTKEKLKRYLNITEMLNNRLRQIKPIYKWDKKYLSK